MTTAKVKRVFVCGPPGGMFTTIDRCLRVGLPQHVDNSDITPQRIWGGHIGAYWHPGNEPSWDWILNFGDYDRDHIIETLDSAYADPIPDASDKEFIIRTHKSHFWAYHYDKIIELFPDADIITTIIEPHVAFMWWQVCGGHDTVFNDYKYFRRNYEAIWQEINLQTVETKKFVEKYNLTPAYYDMNFLLEHYGPMSVQLKRMNDDNIRHPGGHNHFLGTAADGKGLGDNVKVVIKHGCPRQFNL